MRDHRPGMLFNFMPLADGLLIALAGWGAYYLRWSNRSVAEDYLLVIMLGSALAVVLLPLSGAYRSWLGRVQWQDVGQALPGLALVALIMTLVGTMTKTTAEYSRLWMAYWFLLALFNLFLFRWSVDKLQRARPTDSAACRQVIIIGDGAFACSVAQHIAACSPALMRVRGFVATGDTGRPAVLPGPELGSLDQLQSVLSDKNEPIDEAWIAVTEFRPGQREAITGALQSSLLVVRFVPDLSMLALLNRVPTEVAGLAVITLNASPLDGHNALLKSAFDKVFSLLALLLLSPLMCLIAIAIRLDSRGPILFSQQRHGWDGQVFQVLKFRTMAYSGSESANIRQATRGDPRVTAVGRFLRRNSLDELPQFINVLLGAMSVVGPRPHPVALNESYVTRIDTYMQRHRVKPGITGWAQIHGLRGETDTLEKMRKRFEFDLYYIEHWSLWLDMVIILRTVSGGWTGKSAY